MTNLQAIPFVAYFYNVVFLFLMGSIWTKKEWLTKAAVLVSASVGVYVICVFCKTLAFPIHIAMATSFISGLLGLLFMFGKNTGEAALIFTFKLLLILSIVSTITFFYFTI